MKRRTSHPEHPQKNLFSGVGCGEQMLLNLWCSSCYFYPSMMETHWTEALKAQTYTGEQEFLVVVMLAPPSGQKCFSVTVLNRLELEPSARADEGLLIEQFQISGTLLHRQLGGEESLFSWIKVD
ncbi:hypothetical protein fugu_012278 [Takifugu bimaculatus]|uniref:Uncharacterized protein n=1 Tax=Takifugu bimaculatus TaxID=433685 RepID=A0A4Z2C9Y1_9TELE|nr:hypothetical protein fugu_012278 [Takifugu bimaculatus]